MGNTPIVKVARKGYDARHAADRNLSFSSEWKTPKIFMQTSQSYLNIKNLTGYIPEFMGFRELSNEVPVADPWSTYIAGGFDVGDFTHSDISKFNYEGNGGALIFENGVIDNSVISGYTGGTPWSDTSSHMLFFLDPLEGTPPSEYELKGGGVFLLGSGDTEVRETFPYYNSMDSRFDTLKIFKTGTLVLEVPEDTVVTEPKVYSTYVEHDLGYPPIYLPEASIGWIIPNTIPDNFVLNDYLGFSQGGTNQPVLSVYVDSSNLYMKYTRFSVGGSRDITMYYTIFYNEIGEDFNFLDI